MEIIKLNAIDSTNDFLKKMAKTKDLKNLTTVVTLEQKKGKGQQGSSWVSEAGKNLLFTTYIKLQREDLSRITEFNFMVSVTLFSVLKKYIPNKLNIKWPNDILSYKKKIAGILIENTIKQDGAIESFVGIGLNVNQQSFPKDLPQATSMYISSNQTYHTETLLIEFQTLMQQNIERFYNNHSFKNIYLKHLFRKAIPSMFQKKSGEVFMGKIVDVNSIGSLVVEDDNDSLLTFGLKEIKMLW